MAIDLRSDTVTRPTEAMRRAMAAAEVGDDVYGEDPLALRLEARSAELLGKQAAIFVPSGTMANQLALLLHCRAGDEVIVGEGAHCMVFESGGGGAWAGVQFAVAGRGGLFTADELEAAWHPPSFHVPWPRLVALENTHNRAGGRVFPQADVEAVAARARDKGLGVHLDGARIWNASAATGVAVETLCAPADTVSACFSKGLGAPIGSVLAGPRELVERARRLRKMLGGGMRQVGVLCAAALHSLDHHRSRLPDDHGNARALADGLASIEGLACDVGIVETNIVLFDVLAEPADALVGRAAAEGVLLHTIGPRRVRAVTHLDVSAADIARARETVARVVRAR